MNQSDSTFPRLEDEPPARPSPLPGVTWGISDIVLGIVAALIWLFIVSTAIVGPALLAYDDDSLEVRLAEAIAQAAWFAVIPITVYLLVRRKGGGWTELGLRPVTRSLIHRNPPTVWTTPRAGVVTFLAAFGVVWIYSIIIEVAGLDFLEPSRQIETDYYRHTAVIAALGVSIVAGAPFAEELMFRGFIFAGLRRYMAPVFAAALSGSVFAVAHMDIGVIIPFTGVAMIFAFSYERTGSLFPAMTGHFLFNLLSFSILVLVPEAR